ncbi:MAG: ribonuclease III [Ghiorsea sp.]|nr:ribonuclease III [Ghiorsea sp.]
MKQQAIEHIIGYTFKNKSILSKALSHASKAAEHMERQEFLGDSVLGLIISEHLYHQYLELNEGALSKMKANLVCKDALLDVAIVWDLATFLKVGDGERDKQGYLKSPSIAANAVESIIGAVFLDAGWEEAKLLVLKSWANLINQVEPSDLRDAKSKLQELTQANKLGLPDYVITDLGIQSSPRFKAECVVQQKCLSTGLGERKKQAELNAASHALTSHTLAKMLNKKLKT